MVVIVFSIAQMCVSPFCVYIEYRSLIENAGSDWVQIDFLLLDVSSAVAPVAYV